MFLRSAVAPDATVNLGDNAIFAMACTKSVSLYQNCERPNTQLWPVATTTPRGLSAWGPRSASGSDTPRQLAYYFLCKAIRNLVLAPEERDIYSSERIPNDLAPFGSEPR
jgi:hypothetical protein